MIKASNTKQHTHFISRVLLYSTHTFYFTCIIILFTFTILTATKISENTKKVKNSTNEYHLHCIYNQT